MPWYLWAVFAGLMATLVCLVIECCSGAIADRRQRQLAHVRRIEFDADRQMQQVVNQTIAAMFDAVRRTQ